MSGQTNERAFEVHVEEVLHAAGRLAARHQRRVGCRARALSRRGSAPSWKRRSRSSGPRCARCTRPDWRALLIDALVKELDLKGTLHVLRHGFKFYGKTFRLAYFKPAHGLNDEVLALYAQEPAHGHAPGALSSGQARHGRPAVRGERPAGRDLRAEESRHRPELAARRAAVPEGPRPARAALRVQDARAGALRRRPGRSAHDHAAARRGRRIFLPFNRGSHPGEVQCGAGNPQHPSGYRTGYFWEEVLQRDSFLDILGHFMFVEKKEEKVDDGKGGQRRITKETLIFPRYHQLDAVRKIVAAARGEGPGRNYLIQHSAGSGKTNSISWLSHRLASLHDAAGPARSSTAWSSSPTGACSTSSCRTRSTRSSTRRAWSRRSTRTRKQLAAALIDGTKIVITTLQKFPFVLRGLLHAAGAETPGEGDRGGEGSRRRSGKPRSPSAATPSSSTRRTPARPARRRGS